MCLSGIVICAIPLCGIRMVSDLTSYIAGTAETHIKQKGMGACSLLGIVRVGVIQKQKLKQRSECVREGTSGKTLESRTSETGKDARPGEGGLKSIS